MEIKIANGRFKITKKIGHGAFGEIYSAFDIQEKREVAIKLEPANSTSQQLLYEARVYKLLQGGGTDIISRHTHTILLRQRRRVQHHGHRPTGGLARGPLQLLQPQIYGQDHLPHCGTMRSLLHR
jgi:serine/threonine protein kinase